MAHATQRTAFVFAGGGSLGAVQVGMLRELMRAGVKADFVVGSSVGAINAAYFAGAPDAAGVDKLEKIWRGLRRHDVFPLTLRSVLGFMGGAGNLIDPFNLRRLNLAALQFACHRVSPSRRFSLAPRSRRRSHRSASANIISWMAQSEATRRYSRQPVWALPALSLFRRDLLALSTSRPWERSRALYMQSRCLSLIRWCVT